MTRTHATHFVNLAGVKTSKSAGLRMHVSIALCLSLCAKNCEDRCRRLREVQGDEGGFCSDFRTIEQAQAIHRSCWNLKDDGAGTRVLGSDSTKEIGIGTGL